MLSCNWPAGSLRRGSVAIVGWTSRPRSSSCASGRCWRTCLFQGGFLDGDAHHADRAHRLRGERRAYVVTEKFRWFGVVAFVAISMFIGAATVCPHAGAVEGRAGCRAARRPGAGHRMVRREDNGGSVRRAVPRRESARSAAVIPRAQVKDLAIGPLLRPDVARARALALASELCDRRTPATAPPERRCPRRRTQAYSRRRPTRRAQRASSSRCRASSTRPTARAARR